MSKSTEDKLIKEFSSKFPGYRIEKAEDEGFKLLEIDGIEIEDGREDVWIATVYEMGELLVLLNQQKRPEGLNVEVGSPNESASTTDTSMAYSSDFVHRLHVLVCKVLGLDDEDHEDDESAEPLERTIMQLFDQELKKAKIESFKHGLMTGAMPEVLGRPIAEDYIAGLGGTLNNQTKEEK